MHFHLSHVHRTELKPGSVVYILLMCRTQNIYIHKRHVFDNIIKDNKCIYQKVDSLHFIPYHCFTDAAFRLLITFVQGLFVWVEQLAFIHLLLTKARLAVLTNGNTLTGHFITYTLRVLGWTPVLPSGLPQSFVPQIHSAGNISQRFWAIFTWQHHTVAADLLLYIKDESLVSPDHKDALLYWDPVTVEATWVQWAHCDVKKKNSCRWFELCDVVCKESTPTSLHHHHQPDCWCKAGWTPFMTTPVTGIETHQTNIFPIFYCQNFGEPCKLWCQFPVFSWLLLTDFFFLFLRLKVT